MSTIAEMTDALATIIIPNYNGSRFLPRLMESLNAQTEKRHHVILIDDGSTDDSVKYLQKSWPRVRVIQNPSNLGFAATCNVGLRAATTPYVVLLNNDTHLHPDWLAEGLRPFEDETVAAVASLTLLADNPDLVDTAGDIYTVAGGALKRCHLQPRALAEKLPTDCFSPSGVSAFYRTQVIRDAGLLDERFESYYEDIDLGFRIAAMGGRCVFAPRSICCHHLSASYAPRSWRYHYNSARNAEIVWWAGLPRPLRWRYLPAHLAFLLLQGGHKLLQGAAPAWLAGKVSFLWHLPHVAAKRRQLAALRRLAPPHPSPKVHLATRLERNWWTLHVTHRRKQRPQI